MSDPSKVVVEISAFEDVTTCNICRLRFTNIKRAPIGMGCGHTFCRACIWKDVTGFCCPKCHRTYTRQQVEISKKNYVYFHVLEIVDVVAEEPGESDADAATKK